MIVAGDAVTFQFRNDGYLRNFIPESFSWLLFGVGVLLLLADFVWIFLRSIKG
ncbi:MAG: hypothetical protein IPF68_06390 [Bacteroidales bacterium]|nr:hypothetical protein [Bacteroidales bacterium]